MKYIIAEIGGLENSIDRIFTANSPDNENPYVEKGYKRHERIYQLTSNHKDYTIICPEYRDVENGTEPVVIIASFLSPRRKFPIYIYLFAIDLYSRNPNKGQRWAACETRKRFDLRSDEFAHTTLGRTLKLLVSRLETVEADGSASEKTTTPKTEAEVHKSESGNENSQAKHRRVPTVDSTTPLRKVAAIFLNNRLSQKTGKELVETGMQIACEWYKKYQQFLL